MIPYSELEELERARSQTLDLVAGLSQEELDRRPSNGWSVGEVLDHLLKAEESNRREIANLIGLARSGRNPYLRRELTPEGLGPACVPRSLLPLFSLPATFATQLMPVSLRELLIRNRLFPARASQELQPRYSRPGGELRVDLASSAAETHALLSANPDLDYRRMILQHPFLGTNDVHDILRLTAAHEGRHQDQIRGLLRARVSSR